MYSKDLCWVLCFLVLKRFRVIIVIYKGVFQGPILDAMFFVLKRPCVIIVSAKGVYQGPVFGPMFSCIESI